MEPSEAAWRRLPRWVERLARLGTLPSDSEAERLSKATLTLSSTLMPVLSVVWVVTYGALGLWRSAAIPFAYQVASAVSLVHFARTKRYRMFRMSQLTMMLALPFLLQWSLGGFVNSSAVSLWAFTAPVGALVFIGARRSLPWFVAFVVLVGLSGVFETSLARAAPAIPRDVIVTFFVLNVLGVSTTGYVLLHYFLREREQMRLALDAQHRRLQAEQAKSEQLLLNVLPATIASRLKESPDVIADGFAEVSVLFADLVDFTPLAEGLAPSEVVVVLNRVFSAFDELAERHGLEKIKTVGDAYMVAGGLPVPRADHAEAVAEMALEMQAAVTRCAAESGLPLTVRIGIDCGPAVAGVIGRRKFSYDLWGDTVNTASRMESHGLPGRIQTTARAHARLRAAYELDTRGPVDIKGKGTMTTYWLVGRKSPPPPV